jgi:hypothetical protein
LFFVEELARYLGNGLFHQNKKFVPDSLFREKKKWKKYLVANMNHINCMPTSRRLVTNRRLATNRRREHAYVRGQPFAPIGGVNVPGSDVAWQASRVSGTPSPSSSSSQLSLIPVSRWVQTRPLSLQ